MKTKSPAIRAVARLNLEDVRGNRTTILLSEIVAIEHTAMDTTRILLRGGGSIDLGTTPTNDVIEIWEFCLRKGRSKSDRVLCKVTWGSAT